MINCLKLVSYSNALFILIKEVHCFKVSLLPYVKGHLGFVFAALSLSNVFTANNFN